MINNYETLIDAVALAAQKHAGIHSFEAGQKEYFYDSAHSPSYPYCYFQFTTPSRQTNGTELVLEGNIIVLALPAGEVTYGESTYTNGDVTLEPEFSWNRNGISEIDQSLRLLDEVIELLEVDNESSDFVIDNDAIAIYSGFATTASLGWQKAITLVIPDAIDQSEIPVNAPASLFAASFAEVPLGNNNETQIT